MALANVQRTRIAGEYVGTGFYLLLLPLVDALPGSLATKGAGLAWIACDVVAGVCAIWTTRDPSGPDSATYAAVRMAGHLFAAVWVATMSAALGAAGLVVGWPLALSFVAYTLAAGRLPQWTLALPGVLLAGWLLLVARYFLQVAP